MSGIQHSETRGYTKITGTPYVLPHDEEERRRLILQSNLFLRIYDNKVLHAPVELKDGDWVLETGTGTGIWLQDLAKQTPTNPQYIGTDIEPAFFPDPSTLPPNMTFGVQSVTNLPADWTNKFTVLHQRLLIGSIRVHEWGHVINEIYRVLKPGGWVQMFEADISVKSISPALARFQELLYKSSDARGTMGRDITKRLPVFLEQGGFINLHQDARQTPLGAWAGQDGIDGRDNMLEVIRGLKTPMLKAGGFGIVGSEAEYDELVEQIQRELDDTPGCGWAWVMFWAQKPGEL